MTSLLTQALVTTALQDVAEPGNDVACPRAPPARSAASLAASVPALGSDFAGLVVKTIAPITTGEIDDGTTGEPYILDRVTTRRMDESCVGNVVRQIRRGEHGRRLMKTFSRLATIPHIEPVIRRLDEDLLRRLMDVLLLLSQTPFLVAEDRIGRYRPGRSPWVDKLAAKQIQKLDEHLMSYPYCGESDHSRTAGIVALITLVRDPLTTVALSRRSMQLRIAGGRVLAGSLSSDRPVRRRKEL